MVLTTASRSTRQFVIREPLRLLAPAQLAIGAKSMEQEAQRAASRDGRDPRGVLVGCGHLSPPSLTARVRDKSSAAFIYHKGFAAFTSLGLGRSLTDTVILGLTTPGFHIFH
jgi:hypothetical protein